MIAQPEIPEDCTLRIVPNGHHNSVMACQHNQSTFMSPDHWGEYKALNADARPGLTANMWAMRAKFGPPAWISDLLADGSMVVWFWDNDPDHRETWTATIQSNHDGVVACDPHPEAASLFALLGIEEPAT